MWPATEGESPYRPPVLADKPKMVSAVGKPLRFPDRWGIMCSALPSLCQEIFMTHIAIIGAGITGTTTAWALLKRGYDVTIFERNRYAGMETSFANGGQLSASNAEVWNHTSSVLKGMKWLLRNDAPLKFNLAPSWHKYSWMAEFLANIPHYENNTVATVKLAIAAREHMFDTARDAGVDFDLEKRGILHIYENKKSFDHATKVNALLAKGGLERRAVSPQEVKQIEPTLNGEFYGGYYTSSDSTGDIHKFCAGLEAACVKRGATFLNGADVKNIDHKNDEVIISYGRNGQSEQAKFDAVVVSAGVGSRGFAAQLGDRVNVYPVKGYSITVALPDEKSQAATPWTSILDDEAKLVTSRLGKDRFRIAGTAEFSGYNRDIRDDRIRPLVKWCEKLFPEISTKQVIPWAGLRPMMPNMIPRVGAGKKSGIYYNTGHGHLGWTLSSATAEMIAEKIEADRRNNAPKMNHFAVKPQSVTY
jgi:D-amino-acid dehydrogenase